MNYYISRGGQQYGPYSLADLQRYVQQGNISLNDMARSDGMTEWAPVSQIMGNISTPPAAPATPVPQTPYSAPANPYGAQQTPASGTPAGGYGAPATPGTYNPPSNPYGTPATPAGGYGAPATPAAYNPPSNPYGAQGGYAGVPQQGMYPPPPSLHWGVVLAISFVCGFFTWVWLFIQAAWVKKVRPQSKAIPLYISGIGAMIGGYIVGLAILVGGNNNSAMAAIGGLILMAGAIGGFVMIVMANFSIKASIEDFYNREEPIGLKLSGVMTFFFSVWYFQYHFTRITEMKQQAAMQQRAAAGGGQYYGQ
jgi:hypothetical protein